MLFLYIYCLTFVCVVNCNSTDEKLKKLNILVNNDVWSEFENGPRPIEHTNGQSRKISFRELFSKSNGAVFTEENYLEKSKNFHTMLSCNFAVSFKYITIIMNQIWKESKKCSSEENENEEREIEEHENEEDCKNNLGNASCKKFETPPESEEKENDSNEKFNDEKDCYEKLKNDLSEIFMESKIKEIGSSEEDSKKNLDNALSEDNENVSSDDDDWKQNFISQFKERYYEQWMNKSYKMDSSSIPLRVENKAFSATEKTENSSSGEFDVIKYSKDNLIESLDASVPELMRQSLSYFTQLSEIEEKESILPALDMMTQFANDKFSIDSIDDNILKMNNILTEFIKNNCWFNENRTGPMLETIYDIERESWRTCSEPEHYLAEQVVKLHQYFKKIIIDLGFKNVD